MNIAQSINPERAQSLEFRFRHESELLAHASHKSLFGWGGWGRNRVWDEETGEDLSVTDGKWILTLGIRGWSGFLAEFFLITLPLWYAFKIQKRKTGIEQKQRIYLASLALILAIVLLDQMPNASLNPLYVFLAGALLGRAQHLSKTQVTNKPSEQTVKSG
ncbi:hypothetical protein [Methylophaga lonarensis]|uniref:hypothetical protein n=1 Tax=Methylophaga lonarensis TaxID=999151 RepID=UPI00126764F8|nr:hypothetical protein [Methylophaga lonarensis]